jgi:hypothetical protein
MSTTIPPTNTDFAIHLLDVGSQQYGDAVLCRFGETTVLIDCAHPGNELAGDGHQSLPDQIGTILDQQSPYRISLLIITHAHADHIGCAPALVRDGLIQPQWALVADPDLGWGHIGDASHRGSHAKSSSSELLVALLREEPLESASDEEIHRLATEAAALEANYREMIATLKAKGTKWCRQALRASHALRRVRSHHRWTEHRATRGVRQTHWQTISSTRAPRAVGPCHRVDRERGGYIGCLIPISPPGAL